MVDPHPGTRLPQTRGWPTQLARHACHTCQNPPTRPDRPVAMAAACSARSMNHPRHRTISKKGPVLISKALRRSASSNKDYVAAARHLILIRSPASAPPRGVCCDLRRIARAPALNRITAVVVLVSARSACVLLLVSTPGPLPVQPGAATHARRPAPCRLPARFRFPIACRAPGRLRANKSLEPTAYRVVERGQFSCVSCARCARKRPWRRLS